MTVESELKRIADALEVRNTLTVKPAESYTKQRLAEVVAEVGPQKGGPKGSAIKKKDEPPAEPEKVEDDFLAEPEPEVVDLEQVRAALIEYRKAKVAQFGDVKGKEMAVKLLADHGGSAVKLGAANAGWTPGDPGVLDPKFYAAVLKATKA